MISALSIGGRDPEVAVSELALMMINGTPLVSHLDRVRVTKLVRRKSTPHARCGCSSS